MARAIWTATYLSLLPSVDAVGREARRNSRFLSWPSECLGIVKHHRASRALEEQRLVARRLRAEARG